MRKIFVNEHDINICLTLPIGREICSSTHDQGRAMDKPDKTFGLGQFLFVWGNLQVQCDPIKGRIGGDPPRSTYNKGQGATKISFG